MSRTFTKLRMQELIELPQSNRMRIVDLGQPEPLATAPPIRAD